jgi:hypothetical protein
MNRLRRRGKLTIVTMAWPAAAWRPASAPLRRPTPRPTRQLPWPLAPSWARRTSHRIHADYGASSRQAGPAPAHPRGREERRGNKPPGRAALRAWGIRHTAAPRHRPAAVRAVAICALAGSAGLIPPPGP